MCRSSRARATGCATRCPTTSSARDARGHYRGQKQIWFLLRLIGRDSDMNLRATDHPEFDAWRWNDYWVPLDVVIEFKRDVYEMALTELSRFLPRAHHHNRYLRSGMRPQRHDDSDFDARRDAPTVSADEAWPATGAGAGRRPTPRSARARPSRARGCRGGSAPARST